MWTSVLKSAIVKYVLVVGCVVVCGCQNSYCGCQNSDCAKDEFEKRLLPRMEQNIRMGRHPYDGVINAYGVIP